MDALNEIENILQVLLRDDFGNELRAMFPRLREDIVLHKTRTKERLPMVVVGETSSGKSSFLNLMFGADILPVSHLQTTMGLVKIRKGNLVILPKDGDPVTTNNMDILQSKRKSARFVRKNLERFFTSNSSSTGGDAKCRMTSPEIAVYWPFDNDLLTDDVTIVDTPGFGETEVMTTYLREYLPKAVGLVYVVNAGNAGGIQEDRLMKIMKDQLRFCKEHKVNLMDPRRAIFIFNKWDLVRNLTEFNDDSDSCDDFDDVYSHQAASAETVWKANLEKLTDTWADFLPSQALKFSVPQAKGEISTCSDVGADQKEKVRSQIVRVVKESLENGLDPTNRWILAVSDFISESIKRHIDNERSDDDEKEYRMSKFLDRKQFIENLQSSCMQTIRRRIQDEARNISTLITIHAKSETVKDEMRRWSYSEFPDDCSLFRSSTADINRLTAAAVLNKLAKIIRRDMKRCLREFVKKLLDVIKNETGEVIRHLEHVDIISYEDCNSKHCQTLRTVFGTSRAIFVSWLEDLEESFKHFRIHLKYCFLSDDFYERALVHLPALFLKAIPEGSSPHSTLLRITAADVVERVDKETIFSAIIGMLESIQSTIYDFDDLVYRYLNALQTRYGNIRKESKETTDQIIAKYKELNYDCAEFYRKCKNLKKWPDKD